MILFGGLDARIRSESQSSSRGGSRSIAEADRGPRCDAHVLSSHLAALSFCPAIAGSACLAILCCFPVTVAGVFRFHIPCVGIPSHVNTKGVIFQPLLGLYSKGLGGFVLYVCLSFVLVA